MDPELNSHGSLWDVLVIVLLSIAVVPILVTMCVDWLHGASMIAIPIDSLRQIKMVSVVSAQEAALFLLTWGSMLNVGQSPKSLGFLWKLPWQDVLWGVGLGFCFVGINWAGEHVSRLLFTLFMDESHVMELLSQESLIANEMIAKGQATWVRLTMATLIICVAPIVEETFFRGYAYTVFKARWGTAGALLLSSLLFAGVHMYFIHFLPVFLLGFLLALSYEWRQTLVTPIIAHGVMNLLVAVALYYF